MKRVLLTVLFLLVACTAMAQPPVVVPQASKLAWDDTNEQGAVTKFRVYVFNTPGVVPDGVSYIAEVPADPNQPTPAVYEWLISSGKGSYWAVATAVSDDGVTVIETGPSNEVHYVVIGPPTNLRVLR
jgi:hypothetical protein